MHLSDVFLSILLGLPSISPALLANAQQGPADTRARHLFEVFAADDTGGHSYAPYNVTCPTNLTWIRPADSLGKVEKDYLTARNPQIKSAWSTRTSNLNLTAPPRTPVVAIALSGGGYRAMISGSGQAFLQNNTKGSAGDILALSTYVGGLSGGSWAVSSFFANDGLSADELAQNVWNTASNLVVPSDNAARFYANLVSEVAGKANAGFSTQITDYWSLALSDHLFPSQYHTENSPNLTITDIRSVPAVLNASLPYPVMLAVEREPGELVIAVNSTIWEFTLGEFGSWFWGSDRKTTGAFTDIQYLGTALNNAMPTDGCVLGFSNLGYVAGTSSTLFNQAFLIVNSSDASNLQSAINNILQQIGENQNDVAIYPNSFHNWNAENNPIANFTTLTLVDGGETNENVPLDPFLVPYRAVDAIIAFDNSADTNYSWPNGSSLHTSYQKALDQEKTYNLSSKMPQVPSTNGFINGGYNTRPTFFGCSEVNDTVLIVYIPNAPWSVYSNTSTFQLAYPTSQAVSIVDNGRRTIDLNGTVSDWPTCLTCALMDRAATSNGTARSPVCQSCFDTWCWKGDDNTTQPAPYNPTLGALPPFLKNLTSSMPSSDGGVLATVPRVLSGFLIAVVGAATLL